MKFNNTTLLPHRKNTDLYPSQFPTLSSPLPSNFIPQLTGTKHLDPKKGITEHADNIILRPGGFHSQSDECLAEKRRLNCVNDLTSGSIQRLFTETLCRKKSSYTCGVVFFFSPPHRVSQRTLMLHWHSGPVFKRCSGVAIGYARRAVSPVAVGRPDEPCVWKREGPFEILARKNRV